MLQTKVKLEPISHKYYDVEGNQYMSISGVLNLIKPLFERDKLSAMVANKAGVSQESVLAGWTQTAKRATDHGTRIHESIEYFQNTASIRQGDEDLESMIRSICSTYNEYGKVMQEECLFDDEYRIAGTADKILQVTNHKASKFDIEDYKTNMSKGIVTFDKYGKHLLHPMEHMESCNFNTYALQLSFYAFMLERMTGRKVRQMHITFIPPNNYMNWKKIPVPYLKTDVVNILNFYKSSILNKVNETTAVEQEEEPNF